MLRSDPHSSLNDVAARFAVFLPDKEHSAVKARVDLHFAQLLFDAFFKHSHAHAFHFLALLATARPHRSLSASELRELFLRRAWQLRRNLTLEALSILLF
jgi:hypothetical protein